MVDPTLQSSSSVTEEQTEPTVEAGEALASEDLVVDELLVEMSSVGSIGTRRPTRRA
jgi:hypothetical protein